jgi:hypothetical protein
MPDDDDTLLQSIRWLLGFEPEPRDLSQEEIERRLKIANDMVWRQLSGATNDGAAPPEAAQKRRR